MLSEQEILTFRSITGFVNDLGEEFGKKHHPLFLYSRLIKKTNIGHDTPIRKHIDAFKHFCQTNREALVEKNISKLKEKKITYTPDKVYIDMEEIFNLADRDTCGIIWEHLHTISAFVDPEAKTKELLKKVKESAKGSKVEMGEAETKLISNLLDKIEENVGDTSGEDMNPASALSAIFSSGVVTDLVQTMGQGFQDGSLDMTKLFGAVQGMAGQMSSQAEEMGMGSGEDGATDASAQMNMITGMMGNLQGMMSGMNMDEGEGGSGEDLPVINMK